MAKKKVESVADYIASKPRTVQVLLKRVRNTIRKAVPSAEETISYSIPAYKINGRVAIYFAGWKEHFSIYPSSAGLVAALKDELAPYEISKGTIRFPFADGVPVRLIARIAKFRAKELAERTKATRSR
jgi:uncharacterized protein YdhG (YjbR/CyaY superfamily)